MKRFVTAAATAAILLAGSAALADTGFVSAEGEYHWNAKASHYPMGAYSTDQTMSIKHDDGKSINVSQSVHMKDGKTINWGFDGAYDSLPHHGDWITIALTRTKPNAFTNDYIMVDGIRGHEVATITKSRITIRGASFDDNGVAHPYVEVWDKDK